MIPLGARLHCPRVDVKKRVDGIRLPCIQIHSIEGRGDMVS